jgi:CRP-like cAMP-binding protein
MLQHPEVGLLALKLVAGRLRGHADLVDSLSLQQVGRRVARFLLAQLRDHGSQAEAGIEVDVALSNEELARRVGSVREVVSRTLTRLERDGLIAQIGGLKHGKAQRVLNRGSKRSRQICWRIGALMSQAEIGLAAKDPFT